MGCHTSLPIPWTPDTRPPGLGMVCNSLICHDSKSKPDDINLLFNATRETAHKLNTFIHTLSVRTHPSGRRESKPWRPRPVALSTTHNAPCRIPSHTSGQLACPWPNLF